MGHSTIDQNEMDDESKGEQHSGSGFEGKSIDEILALLSSPNEETRLHAKMTLEQIHSDWNDKANAEAMKGEEAYLSDKEKLLETYNGQYAGYYQGKLILIRPSIEKLTRDVYDQIGKVRFYIRQVTTELPRLRIPKR